MATIPESLTEPLAAMLADTGDPGPIQRARPVSGGCINHAVRVDTRQQSYLLKWNAEPLPGLFQVEARGLQLMADTNTIRVPAVLAAADAQTDCPAYIVLEWLQGSASISDPQALADMGHSLAALHRASSATYGLDHDNYLGSTPQYNGQDENWISFYRERRLRPQMELAAHNGYLHAARRKGLERVLNRLDEWLGGVQRQPSLLHGDLWGGNLLPGPDNKLALIDPAVYYGDREAEIAYTELFGGFGSAFYRAYEEAWPLAAGYVERRDLYNLYHLLNHLNIFGESYGSSVDAVVRRYG